MAKWADYIITGVWFTDKHISHVMLHTDNDASISLGTKQTKDYVINLLKNKKIVTSEWDYKTAKWNLGAEVGTEVIGGITYLRTHRNNIKTDNLDKLIDMEIFNF